MNKLIRACCIGTLFFSLSAKADICPEGYRDGDRENISIQLFVQFKGTWYECSGRRDSNGQVTSGQYCGPGIVTGNPSNMRVVITSQEGKEFEFHGNNSNPTIENDCSARAYCISKYISTNSAKNEYVDFEVPITSVWHSRIKCDKVSF